MFLTISGDLYSTDMTISNISYVKAAGNQFFAVNKDG